MHHFFNAFNCQCTPNPSVQYGSERVFVKCCHSDALCQWFSIGGSAPKSPSMLLGQLWCCWAIPEDPSLDVKPGQWSESPVWRINLLFIFWIKGWTGNPRHGDKHAHSTQKDPHGPGFEPATFFFEARALTTQPPFFYSKSLECYCFILFLIIQYFTVTASVLI